MGTRDEILADLKSKVLERPGPIPPGASRLPMLKMMRYFGVCVKLHAARSPLVQLAGKLGL
jgi:hypothetical protein